MPARGKGVAGAPPKRSTARARPVLPREFIAVHKRRRIMDALAVLTDEQGYEATKISDIVRRAAVARDEALRRIEESCSAADDWQEKVEAGLEAFLGYLAEDPAIARMCLIEALSATPATTKRYEDALQRFVEMAQGVLPRDERLPETIEETLIGGVAWIVYRQVRREETERIEALLPELCEFVLGPYVGLGLARTPAQAADS
jgi:AcrR family transcriptional regulator